MVEFYVVLKTKVISCLFQYHLALGSSAEWKAFSELKSEYVSARTILRGLSYQDCKYFHHAEVVQQ